MTDGFVILQDVGFQAIWPEEPIREYRVRPSYVALIEATAFAGDGWHQLEGEHVRLTLRDGRQVIVKGSPAEWTERLDVGLWLRRHP